MFAVGPKAKIGIVSRTSAVEAGPDTWGREGIDAIDPCCVKTRGGEKRLELRSVWLEIGCAHKR